jgi:anti-anti-sigma factor
MNDYNPTLKLDILPPDEKNSYQAVRLTGDMDKAGLDVVRGQIDQLSRNFPYQYFIFDFSGLNFINSESIGFLMMIHSHLVKIKKVLVVVSAKDHVKDVLSVIGILSVIEYHDSFDEFKKKFS